MNLKKRKPAMGAKSVTGDVPEAKEVKGAPLSIKAVLNSAKKSGQSAKEVKGSEAPRSKEIKTPEIEGVKDGQLSGEYINRLKKRMKNKAK